MDGAPIPLLALAAATAALAAGAAAAGTAPLGTGPALEDSLFPPSPESFQGLDGLRTGPGLPLPGPGPRFRIPFQSPEAGPSSPLQGLADEAQQEADRIGCFRLGHDTDGPCEAWAARYAGPANGRDQATDLAVGPNGNHVVTTGYSWGGDPAEGGTEFDYVTAGYDAQTGEELWVDRWGDPGPGRDGAFAVAAHPNDGLAYVTGFRNTEETTQLTTQDALTVAYDLETGDMVWSDRYNGPVDDWETGDDIQVNSEGTRVYVTGASGGGDPEDGGTGNDMVTIAYDAGTGDRVWVDRHGQEVDDARAEALDIGPDGDRLYVTGEADEGGADDDYRTVAYDADTGNELWVDEHGNPWTDEPKDIVTGPEGDRVYVTGYSIVDNEASNFGTLAYNTTTGDLLWEASYDYTGSLDGAQAIGVSPDGERVFVTGESFSRLFTREGATIAYDAQTGTQEWVTRWTGPYPMISPNIGLDLAVGQEGKCLYVTGMDTDLQTVANYGTKAYNQTTGEQLWKMQYRGTGEDTDIPWAIELGPAEERLYVTGQSWGDLPWKGGDYDYATVAYEAGC